MAGGVALFLLGDVWFRRVFALGHAPARLLAALVVAASFPLGMWSSAARLGTLVALLVVTLSLERAP
ncbi:hypothetical protein [Planotetraspora sp. GP83]|uniref:hypothetical protein n=1 Tax=Planotetraspora sp. GP83 TaxID=3156264 RepID=UPI003511ABBF